MPEAPLSPNSAPPSSISLAEALRLEPRAQGTPRDPLQLARAQFDAVVQPGWDIRGTPHGGYLLAIVAAGACAVAEQPDPISVSASFLAIPEFGPATVETQIIRSGKRQTTVQSSLIQHGTVKVHAVITVGTLSADRPRIWNPDAEAPDFGLPEDGFDMRTRLAETGEALNLHERVEMCLTSPVGFVRDQPTGTPVLEGWMRMADGQPPDALALLVFADGMPPSIFEAVGTDVGHVPTIQLTAHLFAKPTPGWIQSRCRTRVQGGGFVDEDAELWDSAGNLVATARQLALLR